MNLCIHSCIRAIFLYLFDRNLMKNPTKCFVNSQMHCVLQEGMLSWHCMFLVKHFTSGWEPIIHEAILPFRIMEGPSQDYSPNISRMHLLYPLENQNRFCPSLISFFLFSSDSKTNPKTPEGHMHSCKTTIWQVCLQAISVFWEITLFGKKDLHSYHVMGCSLAYCGLLVS